jgi:uncharacterized protein YjbJ (UPF0337 family)
VEKIMDENRVVGAAKNLGGKVQESYGRVVGDVKAQAEGLTDQVKGAAQELYGQARDGASQIADAANQTTVAARQTASSFETSLLNVIETQLYTAMFMALGLGWLVGRFYRPQ